MTWVAEEKDGRIQLVLERESNTQIRKEGKEEEEEYNITAKIVVNGNIMEQLAVSVI